VQHGISHAGCRYFEEWRSLRAHHRCVKRGMDCLARAHVPQAAVAGDAASRRTCVSARRLRREPVGGRGLRHLSPSQAARHASQR
jgi:hypothetical protein